jgi:predicted nucleic acid-binding protein
MLARVLTVVYPQPATLFEFASIVKSRAPAAQHAFDAFLVAQMRAAGIGTICTFDTKGFSGYQGISVEAPEAVLTRFGFAP